MNHASKVAMATVIMVIIAIVGLIVEVKLYGDEEYKSGCIWELARTGHANLTYLCPIYNKFP